MFFRFEDIIAWQKAIILGKDVYETFKNLKDYGFLSQIQRAAVSVSNNIAEGFERNSNNEFKQFLYISKGSCGEVRSMMYLAKELGIINEEKSKKIINQTQEITKMLNSLITTLEKSNTKNTQTPKLPQTPKSPQTPKLPKSPQTPKLPKLPKSPQTP